MPKLRLFCASECVSFQSYLAALFVLRLIFFSFSFQSVITWSQKGEKEKDSFLPDHSEIKPLTRTRQRQVRAARDKHNKKTSSLQTAEEEVGGDQGEG